MTELKMHHPRDKAIKGMVCGVPTFGMVHAEFAASMVSQAMPINFGMQFVFPGHTPPLRLVKWDWEEHEIVHYDNWLKKEKPLVPPDPWSLEVAEARNILAAFCLQNNLEWLYFRDDDTIAPPDAITKLYGDKLPIVGGNYPSKQQPPHNLILQDGYLGGYDDWRLGEIVECTNIGMGLTLIHTDVFRDIEKKLGKPWFRTVNSMTENDIQELAPNCGRMTEDVYFCNKARACGYKIHIDTGVQGQHLDVKELIKHYYHPHIQHLVWEDYRGGINWYPRGDHPQRGTTAQLVEEQLKQKESVEPDFKRPEGPVRLDLGCPKNAKQEGFLSVDLFNEADFQGDASDLTWIITQTGMADELKASHILEHIGTGSVPAVLKNWKRALKPGGQIELSVPDFDWAAEMCLKQRDLDPDQYWQQLMMVYGHQSTPGELHRTAFNLQVAEKLLKVTGFEIVDSYHVQYPDPWVQRNCVVVARKPVKEGEEATAVVRSTEEIRKHFQESLDDVIATWCKDRDPQPVISPYDPKEKIYEQPSDRPATVSGGTGDGDSQGTGANGEGQDEGAKADGGHGGDGSACKPTFRYTTSEGAACIQE
jgi:predicted SAM-dependent methyltransferase